ncbi:aldehyde dehydrogenase family protein [Bartonella queenslandensis]|uniref:aldehyde dehydrogenase family protein n=1 Tax=Bartonella queenslandensis TaxID=481138 RepID=UPI001BA8DE85|nr:aldehyde dehydrogenase family protein [Bartonella queenslandensis]
MSDAVQKKHYSGENVLPIIKAITPLRNQIFGQRKVIYDIAEKPVAMLVQAPAAFAHYLITHLRHAPELSEVAREEALRRAGELFTESTLCGLTLAEYNTQVSALTGLPQQVIENASTKIAEATSQALAFAWLGISRGVSRETDAEALSLGCAQSVRRGDVLAVVTPGNGTGVHALWPQAVALGYRVVLRPSEREPLTAQRLVAAMVAAGLKQYVALLPCDHEVVDAMTESADLSLLYGGDTTVTHFSFRNDVLVQGPGRSKIIIGADYRQEDALQLVFESVVGLGGAACVCASSILVEGDAESFAQAFYHWCSWKLRDEIQRNIWLTRLSSQRFSWWRAQSEKYAQFLIEEPQVFNAADNTYQVTPLVMLAPSMTDSLMQLELPVPAVTFASFNRSDDLNTLAPALVITVASGDIQLIERIRKIPTVSNLYIGQIPTVWMHPQVPHDGYLAEFLMITRGHRVRAPDAISTGIT